MIHLARPVLVASVLALLLGGGIASPTAAQVATLVGPDETPLPEVTEELGAELSYEVSDRGEALLAFAQCMRDNGIEMDDPQLDGGRGGFLRQAGQRDLDPQDEDFVAALDACSAILEAARPELDPAAEAERLEQQLALAQCIRDNGYPEYPDPVIGSGGRSQRLGRPAQELGIDARSEEFIEVRSSCAEQVGLDAFGPGPGGPGPGPGGDG